MRLIPRHHRAERDGIAPAPRSGDGWSHPDTAERRGMVSSRLTERIRMDSSRHHRAERDGIAPHRGAEMDGLILIPQSGEGWSHPSPQSGDGWHHRAERDGIIPAPRSGDGWSHPDTAERRGMVSSSRHHRAETRWTRPGTTERIMGWMVSS